MSDFTVYKRDHNGEVVLHYHGQLIERGEHHVCIEARFKGGRRELEYVTLKQGDRFTEWFYDDRWYNVFKVTDRDDDRLKGYYCNLTRPAEIQAQQVAADDLELDIFVRPDGSILLLDEDEYEALDLPDEQRQRVAHAVQQIRRLVKAKAEPFADLADTA